MNHVREERFSCALQRGGLWAGVVKVVGGASEEFLEGVEAIVPLTSGLYAIVVDIIPRMPLFCGSGESPQASDSRLSSNGEEQGCLNVPPAWIKGQVRFLGNEVSDHSANQGACSLVAPRSLLPPLALGTFSQHGLPIFHKLKIREFHHLLPRHEHNNIAVGPRLRLPCIFVLVLGVTLQVYFWQPLCRRLRISGQFARLPVRSLFPTTPP